MREPLSRAEKGAFNLPEFLRWSGLGRTKTLEEIAAGRLHAVKVGRRLLIPVSSAELWLSAQPAARYPGTQA
ncbi:DNA-binding protein [Methylobacterium sp. WL8]|uniref:DNA-binding protein n=1 Tax=Methylobacterium sp. WL8 TaxID=2603899 RepID=UPI001AED1A8F|nr:DNA-binding protein [Methylobacterium sp. WL8]